MFKELFGLRKDTEREPRFDFAAVSVGKQGKGNETRQNEDSSFILSERYAMGVFDGVGSAEHPAQASRMAAKTTREEISISLPNLTPQECADHLAQTLDTANERIKSESKKKFRSEIEMGTTATAVRIIKYENQLYAISGSVGDSRIYAWSRAKRTIKHLVVDDPNPDTPDPFDPRKRTPRELQMQLSKITSWDDFADDYYLEEKFICRSDLSQALGDSVVKPHTHIEPVSRGDIILCLSDGITDTLTDDQIEKIISSHTSSANALAQALVDAARAAVARELEFISKHPGQRQNIRAKNDDMTVTVLIIS